MSNPAAPFVFDANSRRFYHGTRAELKPGDLLKPGNSSNYTVRRSPWRATAASIDGPGFDVVGDSSEGDCIALSPLPYPVSEPDV